MILDSISLNNTGPQGGAQCHTQLWDATGGSSPPAAYCTMAHQACWYTTHTSSTFKRLCYSAKVQACELTLMTQVVSLKDSWTCQSRSLLTWVSPLHGFAPQLLWPSLFCLCRVLSCSSLSTQVSATKLISCLLFQLFQSSYISKGSTSSHAKYLLSPSRPVLKYICHT